MLIVFEGCDAVGKATQSARLVTRLRAHGLSTLHLSFPRYDTLLGQAIKRHLLGDIVVHQRDKESDALAYTRAPEDPLIFQCMMLADKYEAAAGIDAYINRGGAVVCDRWTASALAYGGADSLSYQWLNRIQERLPRADLSVLLELSEEETQRRRPELRDRYEQDRDKQERVRERYNLLWSGLLPGHLARVDAHGTPEEVHERVWAHVARIFFGGL